MVQAEPFSIAFVLGAKQVRVTGIIEILQILRPAGWTQANRADRRTDQLK